MLRTARNYEFDTIPEFKSDEYKIAKDDRINIGMYSNNGYKLLDLVTVQGNRGQRTEVIVEYDGFVNLPILGRKFVEGLTIRQLEAYLEKLYSEFFVDPFVILKVANQKVFIFAGSTASVITLKDDNTTLFEVLADFGGIPENGKADRIKLIRGKLDNPQVFLLDLSRLETAISGDIVLQSDDIIYIETRREYVNNTLRLLTPYLSLITTLLTLYAIILNNPFSPN